MSRRSKKTSYKKASNSNALKAHCLYCNKKIFSEHLCNYHYYWKYQKNSNVLKIPTPQSKSNTVNYKTDIMKITATKLSIDIDRKICLNTNLSFGILGPDGQWNHGNNK